MAPAWRFDQILPEITRRAVRQIHDRAKQDSPFFLYFSMTSPHEPVVPSKDFRGKSGIAPIADFVMETDWSAGQVIKAIDDAGVADNTIVIFTADNGHSHYTGWEQLVDAGHLPSGPYRGHKGDVWEGGHRVPLVIRWPNRIAAGKSTDQMACLTDIFGTCAEIVGADLPSQGAEDSISFLPSALGNANAEGRQSMVNHSNHGEFAYREGSWKLVFKMSGRNLQQSRGKPTITQLYNLDADISEQKDLSEQHPEIVQRMTDRLKTLVAHGTSRPGHNGSNDTVVRFDTIRTKRWGPGLDACESGLQLAGLDLRQVEQIVDDGEHVFAIRADRLDQLGATRGIELGIAQELRVPEYGGHGGPDLVAHVGQELRFRPTRRFCPLLLSAQVVHELISSQRQTHQRRDRFDRGERGLARRLAVFEGRNEYAALECASSGSLSRARQSGAIELSESTYLRYFPLASRAARFRFG